MDLLSRQGLRTDGRRSGELRRIRCKMGVFNQPDGSAYLEQGNTKVVAAIYGPHEIRTNRAKAPNDSAVINCQYSMATFSRSERKRRPRDNKSAELTLHLKQAMATAIKTDLYPKSQIDIFVQTDAVWNNKKNEAWSEIVNAYNAIQTSGVRNIGQIKHMYDTQKREARKEKSQYKVQHYKTGGGTNQSTLSNVTQKVIGLLGDRMDPLLNNVDGDADYNAIQDISGDQIIVEDISGDEFSLLCPADLDQNNSNLSILHRSTPKTSSSISFPSDTPQHVWHAESSSNSSLNKTKPTSTTSNKKIYEGLAVLNNKRLEKTEKTSKFEDELYKIKLLKAKSELETSRLEHDLMAKKFKYESEKMESDVRQNKLKEEMLLLELKHKKKMWGME